MTFNATTAPQLANQAARGNLRALGQVLRDIIGHIDDLSTTELGYIDGVTAGTVTASKALVCDSNKDLGDLRNLDVVNLDAGSNGVAGSVDVFASGDSKGKLTLSCTNQTGNTAVTLTPAAMGQATTITIPDPGDSTGFVALSTAALSKAEVDVLDGVTGGTVTASKALVVGSSKELDTITVSNLKRDIDSGDSLAALTGYGRAVVSGAGGDSGNYSVPTPAAGQELSVFCTAADSDSTAVVVFGDSDDSITLDGTNTTATFDAAGEVLDLYAASATRWHIRNNYGSVALS